METAGIYAWVTVERNRDLNRQVDRLTQYCARQGWPVGRVVTEISGGYGYSQGLTSLLNDKTLDLIVIEQPVVSLAYIRAVLVQQGRRIVVVEAEDEASREADHRELDYVFPGHRDRGGSSTMPEV